MKKIFIVSYTHVSGEGLCLETQLKKFASEDEARECFKKTRLRAIQYVREEFEDEDEETRDVSVKDTENKDDYLKRTFIVCHDDGEMAEVKLLML